MTNSHFQFPEYNFINSAGCARIVSTGCFLPTNVETNKEICDKIGLKINPDIIAKTIGVVERRIAESDFCDTDLLVKAANEAILSAQISADQINKIIVTKFVGDRMLPMTASFLQDALHVENAMHAFDIDGGAHASFQAIDLVCKMPLDENEYVLLVSGGICHRLIQKKDSRHAFLFGDGAGAIVFQGSKKRHVLASYQLTNPTFDYLSQSFRITNINESLFDEDGQPFFYDLYKMENWGDALDFITNASIHALSVIVSNALVSKEDIDVVILSCVNKAVETAVISGLGIHGEKCVSVLPEYGNMLSASLPIAIHKAITQGKLTEGKKALFVSVGEGLCLGFMIYQM